MYARKEVEKVDKKMDSKEFLDALAVLKKEKGIAEETIFEAMELALSSACKKQLGLTENIRVEFNRETAEYKVYSFRVVVESEDDIEDDALQISIKEAKKIVPGIEIGETIEEEITPADFGRVAASTAKQVVIQKIREAERNVIITEFEDKQDELVSGVVSMEDVRNYYIELGKTQGILPKTEIIPGEKIVMGSNIKAYITKVDNNGKGPLILLSRSHYGFVKRLFELEIPEVNEGIILIYSVAREAGVRTKISVYSEEMNVDAVGSCIGERGSRIANVLKELSTEKVDVIPYDKDAAKFIENALSPAKNLRVFITNEKEKQALVIVDSENLSLAIGKKGLNVKLASRLTKYKVDVKTIEQAKDMGINIIG